MKTQIKLHKNFEVPVLDLVDEFKMYTREYLGKHPMGKKDEMEYLEKAFKEWLYFKDWQTRNDSAWDLAQAAVKKTGFGNV